MLIIAEIENKPGQKYLSRLRQHRRTENSGRAQRELQIIAMILHAARHRPGSRPEFCSSRASRNQFLRKRKRKEKSCQKRAEEKKTFFIYDARMRQVLR